MLLTNRVNNFWDDMFNDPFFTGVRSNTQVMKTDIHEKDGDYVRDRER